MTICANAFKSIDANTDSTMGELEEHFQMHAEIQRENPHPKKSAVISSCLKSMVATFSAQPGSNRQQYGLYATYLKGHSYFPEF